MTILQSQIEIYKPLLEQFCNDTKEIEIGDTFSSIFLPHTMTGYDNSERKIFYFGQDTFGWTQTKDLLLKHKDNKLQDYITETSEWINDNGYLDYNNYKSFGFWTLVAKLHLRLKGITEVNGIGNSFYDDDNLELLNDFGYGNTNSIEIKESLIKQRKWESLDQSKYWLIKEKSKIFDKLKYTIQVYNPDLIFIFNWSCDDKAFLEGLEYEIEKLDLINNHFWIINIPKSKTKIIWTVHPNNLMFQGFNVDQLIETIIKFV